MGWGEKGFRIWRGCLNWISFFRKKKFDSMFTINGVAIKDDDVLFDGKVHHRYCENTPNGTYLLSCETGYTHDLTQEFISTLKNVGTFRGNEHLFECD